MPSIETMERNDWAVLWERTGNDQFSDQTVASPVEIKVRWEDLRDEVPNPNTKTQGYDAVVVVACEIPIDSVMWKGRLRDLPGTAETPEEDIYKVKRKSAIPDIKGRHVRRVVYLVRHNDTIPTISE
jgi:hypothetical protein